MESVVWHGQLLKIRRLSPRECFRLKVFSDDLFEKVQAVNLDSQLYKQVGKGLTVNIVYHIGEAILASKRVRKVGSVYLQKIEKKSKV